MAVTKVVMPKLSDAMESGKIIRWVKQEGDRVQGGDILAEVETDKADVEMEAFGSGVLRKVLVGPGGKAPVGTVIAVIAEPNEDISSVLASAPAPVAAPAVASAQPAPAAAVSERPAGVPPQPRTEDYTTRPVPPPSHAPAAAGAPPSAPRQIRPEGAAATAAEAGGERVKASPLARKIAAQSGVDLRLIHGSGPGGRIIRRDVESAVTPEGAPAAAGAPAARRPAAPGAELPEYEDVPLSSMRAAIARVMPLSKGPVPHFYVTVEVAMDRAWHLREELNALPDRPKVSVTDLLIRAAAIALLRHPGVNASFQGNAIRVFHRVHVGLAVALEEGLITPVIRDCQAKSVFEIAEATRDVAERARARRMRANEIGGATFSISNLGMFGVTEFSAIINPPEGAILAVGAVRDVPVVEGDRVMVGRRMSMTLSSDHRVMDGAGAARFLADLKRLLEQPLELVV